MIREDGETRLRGSVGKHAEMKRSWGSEDKVRGKKTQIVFLRKEQCSQPSRRELREEEHAPNSPLNSCSDQKEPIMRESFLLLSINLAPVLDSISACLDLSKKGGGGAASCILNNTHEFPPP